MPRSTLACLLALLILAGCTSSRSSIPSTFAVRGLDFRDYADEGFLITPDAYNGEYLTLGQLSVTMYPGAWRTGVRVERGRATPIGAWVIGQVSAQEAVDSLYVLSRQWGADAIMNFSISTIPHPDPLLGTPGEPAASQMQGLVIEGVAIKRE